MFPLNHYSKKKIKERKEQEKGAIIKRGKGLIRAALVYPNTYRVGMSNLGFQTVYKLANKLDYLACERIFLPSEIKRTAKNRNLTSETIRSIETDRPLNKFELILFSVSFENDFLNLIKILSITGIPLRSCDRNCNHSLVIAGGSACILNPEPIALFIDIFLLGEAECLLKPFFEIYRDYQNKKSLLDIIEKSVSGAFVPAHHAPILYSQGYFSKNFRFTGTVQVQYLKHMHNVQTHTCILSKNSAFKDIFLVEILKGCPYGCRFCTVGYILRPPRLYSMNSICSVMDKASGKTQKIGLISSAILDHPDIKKICLYAQAKGFKLSFSSLRADKLDDDIIQIMCDSKTKTATIAPEAGSDRMRRIINKKLTEASILKAVQNLVEKGIINLRLYFIIGFPFEKDEDVSAIVDLTRAIKSVFLKTSRSKKKIGTITLSINPFIPKPWTPFQWAAMNVESELRRRLNIIKIGLKKIPNILIHAESLRQSKINALLSLGDRETADVLEAALNYGWSRAIQLNASHCEQVIYQEKKGIASDNDTDYSIKTKSFSTLLPWAYLKHNVSMEFLAREFNRAAFKIESPTCLMKDCKKCGNCL